MWVGTVRTTQFGAVTPQTREAPCIQVEAGINLIIARRAYKLQHSHNLPLRSVSRSSRLGRSPRRGDGTIYDASPRRSAAVVPRPQFVLPIGNPDSKRGRSRRFRGWPSADGLMALIEDFRLESSSPEQKFVSQSPADADCLNLGSHKPRLTPAHDEKIARSTEQNAGRCDAESTKPHLSAPIGYEYESSSLSTLFSSCRARRRNDRRLR